MQSIMQIGLNYHDNIHPNVMKFSQFQQHDFQHQCLADELNIIVLMLHILKAL